MLSYTPGVDEPNGPWPPSEERPFGEPRRPREGKPAFSGAGLAIAWILIVLLTGAVVVMRDFVPVDPAQEAAATAGVESVLMDLQGKMLLGGAAEDPSGQELILSQASPQLEIGSYRQRLRYAIFAAEVAGPEEGLAALGRLAADRRAREEADAGFTVTEADLGLRDALDRLWTEGNLDADQITQLEGELGWWGELATTSRTGGDRQRHEEMVDSTRGLAAGTVLVAFLILAGLVVGVGGLLVTIFLIATRRIPCGLPRPLLPHGVLAETFALWMGLFLLLQGIVAFAPPQAMLLVSAAGFFLSLAAIAWIPIRTGRSFGDVAREIGLHRGRGVIVEIACGVSGYLMAFPLVAVGILGTLLLMAVAGAVGSQAEPLDPASGPAHPIVGELASGNLRIFFSLLLLGAVAAPVVEETVFRGLLYRHLRDASRGFGVVLSLIFAGIVNAFIFAIIHPQGWLAVPALMSLAIAFTLAREWRGSLIAPIVMHALVNGLNFTVAFLVLSA